MARYEHLPIYKKALDVAVHFEKVVAGRFFEFYERRDAALAEALDLAPMRRRGAARVTDFRRQGCGCIYRGCSRSGAP